MTLDDLALWQAYSELEPWGEERADARDAIVAYTVWAMSGQARSGSQRTVADFMAVPPERAQPQRITDPGEMESLFVGLHAQMQEVKRGTS